MTTVNKTIEQIVYEGVDQLTAVSKKGADSVKQMREALDGVKNVLGVLGVTVGAGALVTLHYQTLQATAALDDMSEATGASVEGLSAIQRVAKVGGHDFEGLTGQIGRMIKGLREGTEEGGRAARAFQFLDVKTREVDGRFRDTSEILVDFARKLEGVTTRGDRLLLIQDALGKGAERYIPLLKEVAEGTDLHATVTARQAQQAEEAEKNIRRLTIAFEDQRRELVNKYTPAISDMFVEMREGMRIAGGFVNAVLVLGTIDPFKSVGENLRIYRQDVEQLTAARAKFAGMQGYEGQVASIDQQLAAARARVEFLQLQQRNDALRLATPDSLDARDLRLRNPVAEGQGRTYTGAPTGFTADELKRRQQDVIDAAIRADGNRDKIQKALNPFYMTEEEREKAGAAWVKNIIELRDDVNAKIAQYTMNPTSDDEGLSPERDARLKALRMSLLSEEELEVQAHERRVAQLSQFSEAELAALGGYNAIKQQMEQEHQVRILDIRKGGLNSAAAFNRASWQQQTATVIGELANMTAGVSRHNRSLFEINKVAGIAMAIVNAYTGISKTMATYPYPWNIAMAAAHAVAAFAQVQAIRNASFGGGAPAPSIVGSTPAEPVSPVAESPKQRNAPTILIEMQGETAGRDQIRQLIDRINEHIEDGGRIVFR